MKIQSNLTIGQFAALVASKLRELGIDTVLSGGAVVSIYTENKYQSYDADFISSNDHRKINVAMNELGFQRNGKDFTHPEIQFFVEFPTGPLAIGSRIVKPETEMNINGNKLILLSPTQSVMDRLCAFFFWNDRQGLDQAIWIAQAQQINLLTVKKWAEEEGESEKYREFLSELKSSNIKRKS